MSGQGEATGAPHLGLAEDLEKVLESIAQARPWWGQGPHRLTLTTHRPQACADMATGEGEGHFLLQKTERQTATSTGNAECGTEEVKFKANCCQASPSDTRTHRNKKMRSDLAGFKLSRFLPGKAHSPAECPVFSVSVSRNKQHGGRNSSNHNPTGGEQSGSRWAGRQLTRKVRVSIVVGAPPGFVPQNTQPPATAIIRISSAVLSTLAHLSRLAGRTSAMMQC